MKVLVLGNFGFISNHIDVQTIKTREVLSSFHKYTNYDMSFVDLDKWLKRPWVLFSLLYQLIKVDTILFMPGINALKFLSPILFMICKLFNIKVYYIVVGGWFPDLAKKNIAIRKYSSYFENIFVEVPSMKTSLANFDISSLIIPNYRDVSTNAIDRINVNVSGNIKSNIKLVYYSRVMKDKGIYEAIEIAEKLINHNVVLDIYGPFCDSESRCFIESITVDNIFYRGVLTPGDEVYSTLSCYDYILFPTCYFGEGYPGALVDAIIAGVIPIATDWKYNREILNELDIGFVFPLDTYINDSISLIEAIGPKEIMKLKNKCLLKSKSLHAKNAVKAISMVINHGNK